ncbi:hypothetical protein OGAPHI_006887 [Ogataea philodendri]|uniref:alanine--glyoxylate transaminase n=1 Tax=Ogataea philodendri TaxID=1378263 RepID=A0A9P8SZD3_9ASCO|nr:uncharacterized protein OGAPHI_006887 [Ogataea philodendri]KAH3660301.1 hypothetical protein OGAPHI_006887 [Ogataea philodendri]
MSRKLTFIPGPIEFSDNVLNAMSTPSQSHGSPEFTAVFQEALKNTRKVFKSTDPNSQGFVISGSGTLGWEIVGANLLSKSESALVVSTGFFSEHFAEALQVYTDNVDIIGAEVFGDEVKAEAIESKLKSKKYDVITITHTDTSSGVLSNLEEISALVKKVSPETLIVVDAVCATACENLEFDKWGIDYVLTGSQKALGCPSGLSISYASKRALDKAFASKPASYYASLQHWLPIMKSYESGNAAYYATPAIQLVHAYNVALKEVLATTLDDRIKAHAEASDKFKNKLEKLGVKLVPVSRKVAAHGLTTAYYPDGVDGNKFLAKVRDYGFTLATGIYKDYKTKQWELASPVGDLLLESSDLWQLGDDLGLEVLQFVGLDWQTGLDLLGDLDGSVNVINNLDKVLLRKTSGGHCRSSNSNTSWNKSRLVTWNGVLVQCNIDLLANSFNTSTIDSLVSEVDQHHVRVGTVRNKLVADSLFQSSGQGRNRVVVRTTLVTWEHREVDRVLKIVVDLLSGLWIHGSNTLSEENHSTTWTSQGLVGGGGDNIGVLEWRWNHACCYQTGDVSHVNNKIGTNLVCDLSHSLVIDQSAVSRSTSNQNLWSVQNGGLFQHIVVDDSGLKVHSVWHGLEIGGNCRNLSGVCLVTMGKMASVRKIQSHQSLMRLHDGLVNLQVGWRSRKRLNIHTPFVCIKVESFQSSGLTEQLHSVDVLVTTVVSGTRVTLGVLVAHWRSQGIKHSSRGEVLRSNQNNRVSLSFDLILDDGGDLRVDVFQMAFDELSVGV